jgi:cytoskeletal protein CcmA (bactofilin family)
MPKATTVPARSTVALDVVEGDLQIGERAIVKGTGTPPKVKVLGIVNCQGHCVFECNLQAEGLEAENDVIVKGNLEIENSIKVEDGFLEVDGNITARRIDVEKRLSAGGDLKAEEVDVGGTLQVKGVTATQKIDVGGRFIGNGEVKTSYIDVGGSVIVESKVEAKSIDVGGAVSIKGGVVGKIDVGGSFESKDSLEFDSIDVGGSVKLTGNNKGNDIDVGGSLKVEGNIKFRRIDVGGVVEISGWAEGESIDIGGKLHVSESLALSGKIDVGGKAEVDGDLTAQTIDIGGSLKANQIKATDTVSVGGILETKMGAKASKIKIGKNGEVVGPIFADEAFIREKAHVEDIHAKTIVLKEKVTARNIYGENVFVGSQCHITGEVQYTDRLDAEKNVFFAKTPQKVEKLP